jgi:D-alanyl-D-alanine carboxypeptidase/D-alanyl-D-alanine-endopeptidase (penicillin-binding protein 4)
MRRLSKCLAFVAVFAAPGWASGLAQDLATQIGAMVAEPAVARAHWGVMVTGLDGTPIYALNAVQLFQPASNAKLFTTTAAVHLLGEEQRFTTVVEGPPGSKSEATLKGDLTLRGAGDANLSGRTLPYPEPSDRVKGPAPVVDPLRYLAELADGVVAAGVKRITGDIIGDDTKFPWQPYAADWAADDLVWGYGAPVSALTINDNQVQLKVTAGARAGAAATVVLEPAVPYYTLQAAVQTVAAKAQDGVVVDRELGSRVLKVSGTIAAGSPVYVEELALQDPAEYAAIALKGMLEARGVQVDGHARAQHRLLKEPASFLKEAREPLPQLPMAAMGAASQLLTGKSVCLDACPLSVEHTAPTVIEDITLTNKVSQNLHAELLLHQLGKAYGSDGSTAQGARVVRQFLLNAGLDTDDFVFYDGSGLSGHDLVTPRAVAKLLQFASTQPWFADWKKSLPVGGVDGSLTGRFTMKPLKGHVFAKTGTLGEARALSGYLECASGRTVIFSILVGSHAPGTNADRAVMDRMVAAIAAAN